MSLTRLLLLVALLCALVAFLGAAGVAVLVWPPLAWLALAVAAGIGSGLV